ncbi:MAG TPA: AraC family transcriptional regulator [Burkholderiales bacterium]|nr:AraC family transcriptional regulator [Burkholderiales bacterium]
MRLISGGAGGASAPASARVPEPRLSSRPLGWRVLNFERYESGPSSRQLPNGPSEHLVFVSLGEGTLWREANGERVRHALAPGFITVLPRGHAVRWSWSTPIHFSVLALAPAFLEAVARRDLGLGPDEFELQFAEREQDAAVLTIAGALAREALRGDAGSRVYAESLAGILAVHLLRAYSSRTTEPDRHPEAAAVPRAVSRALAFIQANYAQGIGLKDIAAAARVSPYHLTRLFKRATGLAPYQYLIRARVHGARSLLTAGGGRGSLAEIAAAVGFADQSHLTRHFKRVFGVTPRRAA